MKDKDVDLPKVIQCYRLLGLPIGAQFDEIELSFKNLRKVLHPDKHHQSDTNNLKIMTEKFIILKNAYDFLKKNFNQIREALNSLEGLSLVTLKSTRVRSHMLYTNIGGL